MYSNQPNYQPIGRGCYHRCQQQNKADRMADAPSKGERARQTVVPSLIATINVAVA